jgi:hypothetical protein
MKTSPASLFASLEATDPMYIKLRDAKPDAPQPILRGRTFSQELWKRTSDYLDPDLPAKATRAFHQCYWEMYLAAVLLDLDMPLVPRELRKHKGDAGPDIQVGANVWIEAIAVEEGNGPDAVPHFAEFEAYEVPDDQMKLRLISGLSEKRNKFERYLKNGLINTGDTCIIAVNTGLVGPLFSERFPHRAARALLGIGAEVLHIDVASKEIVGRSLSEQSAIRKVSGNEVGQSMFLDGSCPIVSACIQSEAHWGFFPHRIGSDFVTVHNPSAATPLRRRFVARGTEYWVDDGQLTRVEHDQYDAE